MRGSPAAYQWQYDKADLKYCPRCGAPFTLEDVDIPGRPQLVCHACKFVFYLDPKLAVLAIVTFGSRILLLKRAKEPGKGKWALLAGFVERGEDPFLALKREAQEETGLEIRVERVLKVKAFPDAGMVQLIFEAAALSEQIMTNAESKLGLFRRFAPVVDLRRPDFHHEHGRRRPSTGRRPGMGRLQSTA